MVRKLVIPGYFVIPSVVEESRNLLAGFGGGSTKKDYAASPAPGLGL
jgi:hypothetical protein